MVGITRITLVSRPLYSPATCALTDQGDASNVDRKGWGHTRGMRASRLTDRRLESNQEKEREEERGPNEGGETGRGERQRGAAT